MVKSKMVRVAFLVISIIGISTFTGCDDKSSNNEIKAIIERVATKSPYINLTASDFFSKLNTSLQTIDSKLQYKISNVKNDDTNNNLYKAHKAIANKNFDIDIVTYTKQNNKIESIMLTAIETTDGKFKRKVRENSLALIMTLLNLQNSNDAVKYFPKGFLNEEFFINDNGTKVENFNVNNKTTHINFSLTRLNKLYIIQIKAFELQ